METLTKCVPVLRVNDSTELKTNRGILTVKHRPFISQLITRELMPSQLTRKNYGLHPASLYPDITHRVVMELNNKLINAAWFFAFITFSIIREMLCCLYLFLCFCFTILSWKKKPTKTHINNLRKKPLLIGSWHRRYNIEI